MEIYTPSKSLVAKVKSGVELGMSFVAMVTISVPQIINVWGNGVTQALSPHFQSDPRMIHTYYVTSTSIFPGSHFVIYVPDDLASWGPATFVLLAI